MNNHEEKLKKLKKDIPEYPDALDRKVFRAAEQTPRIKRPGFPKLLIPSLLTLTAVALSTFFVTKYVYGWNTPSNTPSNSAMPSDTTEPTETPGLSEEDGVPQFDNTLPMKQITVDIDYGILVDNKVSILLSEELDLANQSMFHKNDTTREINNLLPGDNLEVYFKDDSYEEINHILVETVDELSEIQVTNLVAPGSDEMDIFVEYKDHPDVAILHQNIQYVINEDQTYTPLNSLGEMFMDLYGTYKESEIKTYTSGSVTIQQITLIALYSYPPRVE